MSLNINGTENYSELEAVLNGGGNPIVESLEFGYSLLVSNFIGKINKDSGELEIVSEDEYKTIVEKAKSSSSSWIESNAEEIEDMCRKLDIVPLNTIEKGNGQIDEYYAQMGIWATDHPDVNNGLLLIRVTEFQSAQKYFYKTIDTRTLLYFLEENGLLDEIEEISKEVENHFGVKKQVGREYEDYIIKESIKDGYKYVIVYKKDGRLTNIKFKGKASLKLNKKPSSGLKSLTRLKNK